MQILTFKRPFSLKRDDFAEILPNEVKEIEVGSLVNYQTGLDLRFHHSERWGLLFTKTYWTAKLDHKHPLLWYDQKTKLWYSYGPHEPNIIIDLGSIPPPLQGLFPATEAPYAYFFHDCAYKFGGLWVASDLKSEWKFKKLSRSKIDRICLLDMMEAGGIPLWRRRIIWSQVRMYGWACWSPKSPNQG